jgi:hypothetical protein
MSLNEEFDPKPRTTKDYLIKLVNDVQLLQEGQMRLENKVKSLEDDLIKREARNKIALWTIGTIGTFSGAIISYIFRK